MILVRLPETADDKRDARRVIREMVMTLPYWLLGAQLDRIDAHEEILAGLDAEPEPEAPRFVLRLSEDARKHLRAAMSLTADNGMPTGQISEPLINRYYVRILRTVVAAEAEKENKS